jgi:hypothetical protein
MALALSSSGSRQILRAVGACADTKKKKKKKKKKQCANGLSEI